jgi:hypothetical protein
MVPLTYVAARVVEENPTRIRQERKLNHRQKLVFTFIGEPSYWSPS